MPLFDPSIFDPRIFDGVLPNLGNVSDQWAANQFEDISAPSVLRGYVETRTVTAGQPVVTRWDIDNTTASNVISATITDEFDYSRVSMPLCETKVTVENATYAGDESADYDFVSLPVKAKLARPGSINLSLGYQFDDGSVEMVQSANQNLELVGVDDDDLYATFEGLSFTALLDDDTFYGGRYVSGGIAANTLFSEVLTSARFAARGYWNYILGESTCVVSNSLPLWATADFPYWEIDSALASVMVEIPIPPVTHREALTMLAAYTGAYLLHRTDGSLLITPTLPAQSDYTLGENQVYDRPKTVNGTRINRINGTLKSYSVAPTAELVYDADIELSSTNATTVTITHDACAQGALTVTGGTVTGTTWYRTYSTVFNVTPSATTLHVHLSAKRVEINTRTFEKAYMPSGTSLDLNCPIASDPTMTIAMYDHYAAVSSATGYEFTMRDDPAIVVGTRLYLQLMSTREYGVWNYRLGDAACVVSSTVPLWTSAWSNVVPVVVTRIARKFDGALDADYTVTTDIDV